MNSMRKFSLFLAAALISLSALAETAKITPTWEANYRTKDLTPSGWTKVTTTDANFEISNNARFFAVQTWTIANVSQVSKLEFMYQRVAGQTNNADVSMWLFPYNSMVTSTANFATDGMAFLNDVREVLGVYPGNTIDSVHAPFAISASVDTMNAHFRVITLEGEQLAAFIDSCDVENDYLTVNLLLNSYKSSSNYKFYHTGDAASYCNVTYEGAIEVPAILNMNTHAAYADTALALAVAEANAGDVLSINEDVAISGARLEIKKALTIQGANDSVKLICGVPYNTLMVLANDNTADYIVSFKNLIVDGQSVQRDRQLFDLNGKAKMAFDGVRVINTTYNSEFIGDVKTAGSNVILSGANSFPAGIALNKDKRVDHQGATHADSMRLILASDYRENYAIVLNCKDSSFYYAVDVADEYDWTLYVSGGKELKGTKAQKPITNAITNKTTKAKYDSLALAVAEANEGDLLMLYMDVTIDTCLLINKALTIQGHTGAEKIINAVPANELAILVADTVNYTVVLKNLIVDGQDSVRAIQTFDSNGKATLRFEGVSVINTTYLPGVADVKCAGNNIVLAGLNNFPAGIALNKNKRIDHQNATHTAENPMLLVLASDYAEDYAIVLHCADSSLYTAVDVAGHYEWTLYVGNGELKGTKAFAAPIINQTTKAHFDTLANAVAAASAGDVLLIYENVAISDARLVIKQALTIEGFSGAEAILCAVPANTLMVLVNDTTEDYTVTFRNLTIDGQGAERSIQLFETNNKGKLAFENVSVANTTYAAGIADVKCAGGNIILSGLNDFPAGIALNKNKRVDHKDATHTAESPIKLLLAADYVEDYAIVLHCADSTLYTAVDVAGETEWTLYVGNNELKGRKVVKPEGVEDVATETKAVKIIRDGKLYILRGEEKYNVLGIKL